MGGHQAGREEGAGAQGVDPSLQEAMAGLWLRVVLGRLSWDPLPASCQLTHPLILIAGFPACCPSARKALTTPQGHLPHLPGALAQIALFKTAGMPPGPSAIHRLSRFLPYQGCGSQCPDRTTGCLAVGTFMLSSSA